MKENQPELWKKKIAPRVRRGKGKAGGAIVVKAFRDDKTRNQQSSTIQLLLEYGGGSLPYSKSIVKASSAIDVWSFGLLLYHLCTGQSLLPVDRDDDLADATAMNNASSWTDKELRRRIRNATIEGVEAKAVKELLCKLLRVNPAHRPRSMDDVLNDPFFRGVDIETMVDGMFNSVRTQLNELNKKQVDTMTQQQAILDKQRELTMTTVAMHNDIAMLSDTVKEELNKAQKHLLRGIFESTEVTVPSCFTIVHERLVVKEMTAISNSEQGHLSTKLSEAQQFVDRIYICLECMQNWENSSERVIEQLLGTLCEQKTCYLYLVDEYTMEPVIPEEDSNSIYPIEITTASEFAPALTILLETSWKAVMVAKGASGLARCLGLPSIINLPAKIEEKFNQLMESMQSKSYSSVSEYERIDAMVTELKLRKRDSATPRTNTHIRGASLREFERFLLAKDTKKEFGGLKRLWFGDDGKVGLWRRMWNR